MLILIIAVILISVNLVTSSLYLPILKVENIIFIMKYTDSNFLITGGAGFIGSHLTEFLLSLGAKEIRILDNLKCGNLSNISMVNHNVKFYQTDIGRVSEPELDEMMKDIDYVFHLAAEKHNQSKDSPEIVIRSNINGTYKLLNSAQKNNVKKVIFTSSLYAYGEHKNIPMTETQCPAPSTIYGISKIAGENLFEYFKKNFDLDYSTARLFFVYGTKQYAGQGYKSVILKNFERIINGQSPIIFGDGEQSLDYIYIDDVLKALVQLLNPEFNGELFNIGTGRAININELTFLMLKVANSQLKPIYQEHDKTHGTIRCSDSSKAQEFLKWKQETSIQQGLTYIYRWLKNGKTI